MIGSVLAATLDVPGASIHYELRGQGPLLVLHAAPMDATSFEPLAALLATRHTVLTSDPRGIHRSTVTDPDRDVTPDQRADDLGRLLEHIDRGPATVLGSSGGAISALALTQRRPDLIRTVIAHEPPLAELLPDRDELRAAHEAMVATYLAGDRRGYWQAFLRTADIHLPNEVFEMMFAGPIEGRQAADERFFVEHMDLATTFWTPDLEALRTTRVRLIVGIGQDSGGQLCDRSSRALAKALDLQPAPFPGGHIGFVDTPEIFSQRLVEVITQD
ncbi:MAG TPA: alpha/beta hydrolase [Kribbella sp.]|nr:alpha/beta hydrolase [Kribbella sp.]